MAVMAILNKNCITLLRFALFRPVLTTYKPDKPCHKAQTCQNKTKQQNEVLKTDVIFTNLGCNFLG